MAMNCGMAVQMFVSGTMKHRCQDKILSIHLTFRPTSGWRSKYCQNILLMSYLTFMVLLNYYFLFCLIPAKM